MPADFHFPISGRWFYRKKKQKRLFQSEQCKVLCSKVHLWTLNRSSHAEEPTRSKCNECDGNLGLYLQHFFSFILTSVFFASAEFAEPLSIWVLDMLKCALSLSLSLSLSPSPALSSCRRPGWSENRGGIRHIAASVSGFHFFFFLHYVKNAAFFPVTVVTAGKMQPQEGRTEMKVAATSSAGWAALCL